MEINTKDSLVKLESLSLPFIYLSIAEVGKIESVKKMLRKGLSLSDILEFTEFSIEEIGTTEKKE